MSYRLSSKSMIAVLFLQRLAIVLAIGCQSFARQLSSGTSDFCILGGEGCILVGDDCLVLAKVAIWVACAGRTQCEGAS